MFACAEQARNGVPIGSHAPQAIKRNRAHRSLNMSTVSIKFGTSGWRAIVADEFTTANVRRAVTGIARYVVKQRANGARVIVARDPRFLGEKFSAIAAEVLLAHGVTPLVTSDVSPTPAVAHEIMRSGTDGAINFTASHNPPEYNGIKFSTPDGAPALPDVTHQIEAEIAALKGGEADISMTASTADTKHLRAQEIDVRPAYLARLREIVDLEAIKQAGIRIVFDPMWGAARGYPDTLLRDAGIEVTTLHDVRDVLFGGHAPEPDEHLLAAATAAMHTHNAALVIATDGDADRFGIVDQDGTFVQPNYVIALMFDYLVETRGWSNGVAKSVATTNLVNALAEHHKVPLHETPVGFKYIGELIKQDKIVIGGEESAGLSIRYHVPEKDGILAGLLCCEMVARRKAPLGEQIRALFAKVGSFYPHRDNFRLTDEVKQAFTNKVKTEPRELGGRRVASVVRTDGLKLLFDDGSWVCYRLSGTEPVVRVYSEARSPAELGKLGEAARQWIFD